VKVYRVSKSKYKNDLEGIGAKLYGGRWNNIGVSCLYTSESRALAVLEFASNVELALIPRALHISCYEVPESEFVVFSEKDMPGDWKEAPSPQSTKDFGSNYFKDPNILGIRVPSTIIPDEFNYLINPESDELGSIEALDSKDFIFDVRIKM
jgi:RES domain-containing protein